MSFRRLKHVSLKSQAAALVCAVLFAVAPATTYASSVAGQPLDDALKDDFFTFFHLTEADRIITPTGFCKVTFKPPPRTPFRDLATITVLLGRQGKIRDMELVMNRGFIEHERNGVFARDLTKSFIGAAVPVEDREHVTGLMNEIFFRQTFTIVPVKKKPENAEGSDKGKSREKKQDTEKDQDKDKDRDKIKDKDNDSDESKLTKILKAGSGELQKGDIIVIGGPGDIPELPANVSDQYQVFAGSKDKYSEKLSKCTIELINETRQGNSMFVATVKSLRETSDEGSTSGDILPMPMTLPTLR